MSDDPFVVADASEPLCRRCRDTGYDPEDHNEDPYTGAPEPAECRECARASWSGDRMGMRA